jgi:hypothetical protein
MGPPLHPDCRCAVGLTDKTSKIEKEMPVTTPTIPISNKPAPEPSISDMLKTPTEGGVHEITDEAIDALEQRLEPHVNYVAQQAENPAIGRAFDNYIDDEIYLKMNGALRKNPNFLAETVKDELGEDIQNLHKLIKNSPAVPADTVAYRGIDDAAKLGNFKKGDVMEMPGFQSASINPRRGASFALGDPDAAPDAVTGLGKAILMEIKNPKGVYLQAEEQEFLAAHRSQYKILGSRKISVEFDFEPFEIMVLRLEQIK